MTKQYQERFQKAFLIQVRETLRGNISEANRARELAILYRKKAEER